MKKEPNSLLISFSKGGRKNVCDQDASCVLGKLGLCLFALPRVPGQYRGNQVGRPDTLQPGVEVIPFPGTDTSAKGRLPHSMAESIAKGVSKADQAQQLLQHYSLREHSIWKRKWKRSLTRTSYMDFGKTLTHYLLCLDEFRLWLLSNLTLWVRYPSGLVVKWHKLKPVVIKQNPKSSIRQFPDTLCGQD